MTFFLRSFQNHGAHDDQFQERFEILIWSWIFFQISGDKKTNSVEKSCRKNAVLSR